MLNDQLNEYLSNIMPPKEDYIVELEGQAEKEKIPIMDPLSIHFLTQLIRINKPTSILEIGTAIGYSALRMLEAYPTASIVSIERDEQRYKQAIQNIKKQDKQANIHVIFGDALDKMKELPVERLFDVVLIDAAKGQYKRFFELSESLLAPNGIILSDNVLFKGYVADSDKHHPRYEKIAEKIRAYNAWLMRHPNFLTSIVPIGDGIAVSIKK